MPSLVLNLADLTKKQSALAGGKAANLGELLTIDGIHVPDGFCVTTEAFRKVTAGKEIQQLIKQLSTASDIKEAGRQLRDRIETTPISAEITAAIDHFIKTGHSYAIRSSATAEDLPDASFAGQQDTFLHIIGRDEIMKHISKCWASLFTERAIVYRNQQGFDHHKVQLAVVVQQMVLPQVSGIMFTADPVSGNRKVTSIDASFGLGEALVAGLVNADNYKLRDGRIIEKNVAKKTTAVYPLPGGGTTKQSIDQQEQPALTDAQLLMLEKTGRRIEAHFGSSQDIEWCYRHDQLYIVQSRPITTLYPVPSVNDEQKHVYISVGHQQMMTDVMLPLGISFRQLITPRPMYEAGGRMFVDIAQALSTPALRNKMIDTMEQLDPLIKDAVVSLLDRGDFIETNNDHNSENVISTAGFRNQVENDPSIAANLVVRCEKEIEMVQHRIKDMSGIPLLDFIREDTRELITTISDPQSMALMLAVMDASAWINEKMKEWLGEKNVADILTQSAPGNITSMMGLDLLHVADRIRPHTDVIDYLQQTKDRNFLEVLPGIAGGIEAKEAIEKFLANYGMRCTGEIDITRTRWSEAPLTLIPLLLSNIRNMQPGAGYQKFEQGLTEATKKEQELLDRLHALPEGEQKSAEVKRMIDLVRMFAGYREYPKYHIVSRYFIYKKALLQEAERLVYEKAIRHKDDIYYLNFDELYEAVKTRKADQQLIGRRREEYRRYEKLTPPRVMTSEGEMLNGRYNRDDIPAGALAGLAVSSGIVEGRARVIINMEEADLEEGDILVTKFTDPSWTPLFVLVKGLVTEVGGLMTHGSVIAREYGLPAVVGVENATQLIRDGQRIKINGTDGWVAID